jgi:hypothetical protein
LPHEHCFFQRRGRAGAVAHVGDRDLHGVFVHLGMFAQDFGADDRVLHEVLRHAAADHQEARVPAAILMSVSSRKSAMESIINHVLLRRYRPGASRGRNRRTSR